MKVKENFSQLLSEARKNKKMTQQSLAEQLHISDKAISNWENGKNVPDKEIIKKIEEILELELIEKEPIKKDYFKMILISITSMLTIILIPLSLYFINNYNKVKIYELNTTNKDYYFESATILETNKNLTIQASNLIIYKYAYQPTYKLTMYYKNNTKDIIIFEEENYENMYITIPKNKNIINNLYLKVEYKNYSNENKKITLKLNNKKIYSNNKLFYKEEKEVEIINKKTQALLINNGYKRVKPYLYEKKVDNKYLSYNLKTKRHYLKYIDNNIEYHISNKRYGSILYTVLKNGKIIEYITIEDNSEKKYYQAAQELYNEFSYIQFQ